MGCFKQESRVVWSVVHLTAGKDREGIGSDENLMSRYVDKNYQFNLREG